MTLHLLDADFDTGPILSQERFENLSDDPSLADLTLSALAVAPMLLNNLLDDLDHYIAGARSQDTGSYWPGEQPEEG